MKFNVGDYVEYTLLSKKFTGTIVSTEQENFISEEYQLDPYVYFIENEHNGKLNCRCAPQMILLGMPILDGLMLI